MLIRAIPRVAAILAVAGSCSAADIARLLKEADAVVVATPTAFDDRSDAATIALSVSSWLSAGSGNAVKVAWDAPPEMGRSSRVAGRFVPGIWFLKRLPDGRYEPIALGSAGFDELYFPVPQAGNRAAAFAYGPDTPVAERIALDLAAAAATERSEDRPGLMVGATAHLARLPRVHDACAYLAQMPGSRQKAIGLACLINAGDPAGIAGLENNLAGMDERDLVAILPGVLFGWTGSDPAAVTSLGRIATSPATPYRIAWGAGKALSYVHTVEALPYLAELLYSEDREMQIDGVFGLWAFANGMPVVGGAGSDDPAYWKPSPTRWGEATIRFDVGVASPDADIEKCVAFWKDWRQANQKVVQSGAR
jgi:hypothetical protein